MAFSETILPTGKILYKGLENMSCKIILRDTRLFYLTESARTAGSYGNLCHFKTKKTLRLFDLTHSNIEKVMKYVSKDTGSLLRTILGTGVTIGEQVTAMKLLLGNKGAGKLPRASNTRRGQRLSYKDVNRVVFGNLAREFLIPAGYDGYYSSRKHSIFHDGEFHSEIMLVDAYRSIEKTNKDPVVSRHSFKWALPRLFMNYCKGTTRLVKSYGPKLILFCTGGMAVRLFLQEKKVYLTPKIRRTSDFDFTFAVPAPLKSDEEVQRYVNFSQKIMTDHLVGFVKYLNREYQGINARLKITRYRHTKYDAPRLQVPGTGRKVYQISTYQIVTGKDEVTDIVDAALALYPKASRTMLSLPFSNKIGIPIQKLKYQLIDSMALLSGSFLHKGIISKRNPLTGSSHEKGHKNAERLLELLRVSKSNKTLREARRVSAPLLENIVLGNLTRARKHARSVNRVLKKMS